MSELVLTEVERLRGVIAMYVEDLARAERERDDWHTLADARSAEIVRVMGERDEARAELGRLTLERAHETTVAGDWHDQLLAARALLRECRVIIEAERRYSITEGNPDGLYVNTLARLDALLGGVK